MSRFPRVVLLNAVIALLAAAGTVLVVLRSTDGDPPAHAEVVAAIKRDPRTADVSDPAASCVADWYLRHASDEQLSALLEGDAQPPADATMSTAASTAILNCLKEATSSTR